MTTKPEETRAILRLGRAAQALAKATNIADITAIRDTAEAARVYARSARLGLQLQNQAAEIRLRAERKAGMMLGDLVLHGGARRKSQGADANARYPWGSLKLTDLGITKKQSSRWQRLAAVPEDSFCKYVATANQLGEELSASGLLRLHRQVGENDSPARRPNRGKPRQAQAATAAKDNSETSRLARESSAGCADCGMQCLFCHPATVRDVSELVGELKDHRAMLAGLLQQDSGEGPANGSRSNGRLVRRYLSEIATLLDRLDQMLSVVRETM